MTVLKDQLRDYLQVGRDALLWKVGGTSDYDARRPMTPTATNLLGIVKHVASVEAGYLGDCFGRPFPQKFAWFADDAEDNADMWVPADESRESIIDLYHRVWAHSDATIDEFDLDAAGEVPWWAPAKRAVTLGQVLVHMIAETHRHAGHADIIRELIDGEAGWRPERSNLPPGDRQWWADYRNRVERAAREAGYSQAANAPASTSKSTLPPV
ncbi:MAG TPA: DinB family protein [Actinomycetota bacterium]|nr:DinB family protein [Actinomycetota bacterium]